MIKYIKHELGYKLWQFYNLFFIRKIIKIYYKIKQKYCSHIFKSYWKGIYDVHYSIYKCLPSDKEIILCTKCNMIKQPIKPKTIEDIREDKFKALGI